MRGFYAGLIAGVIGGISVNIVRIIEAILGLPSAIPGILTVETALFHLFYEMGAIGIFGALIGVLYSKFHNGIPGKGRKKGLIFGLLIGLFSNIWWVSAWFLEWLLTGIEYCLWELFELTLTYFAIFPLYGVILGLLYERWK